MQRYREGAVLLHRKLVEWQWYQDANIKAVFLHLLLLANWKDQLWKTTWIRRGQRLTSYGKLAAELGLTLKQVRRAVEKLRSSGELITSRAANGLLVSIVNYEIYQSARPVQSGAQGRERAKSGQLINKETKENKHRDRAGAAEKQGAREAAEPAGVSAALRVAFSAGGWAEVPEVVGCWLERYPQEWIMEAFGRAVKNCGSAPPPQYITVTLENFRKNGGVRADAGIRAKRDRISRSQEANGASRRKFADHPAGSSAAKS